MAETVETLRQLLDVLCKLQSRSWFLRDPGHEPSTRACETWEMLVSPWSPIEEKELSALFSHPEAFEIDFSERRKVLYLPPLQQDAKFVPVLSLQGNFDEARTEIKLRVMLVCYDENEKKLCGIGFRLDRGEGRHGFYHAQLIRSLERGQYVERGPSVHCPRWLPETQPSFPLAADCPVTLMLCLLLSLYGIKYCWTLVTEHQISGLKSHLKGLAPR